MHKTYLRPLIHCRRRPFWLSDHRKRINCTDIIFGYMSVRQRVVGISRSTGISVDMVQCNIYVRLPVTAFSEFQGPQEYVNVRTFVVTITYKSKDTCLCVINLRSNISSITRYHIFQLRTLGLRATPSHL